MGEREGEKGGLEAGIKEEVRTHSVPSERLTAGLSLLIYLPGGEMRQSGQWSSGGSGQQQQMSPGMLQQLVVGEWLVALKPGQAMCSKRWYGRRGRETKRGKSSPVFQYSWQLCGIGADSLQKGVRSPPNVQI
jgi:hypothetical protein